MVTFFSNHTRQKICITAHDITIIGIFLQTLWNYKLADEFFIQKQPLISDHKAFSFTLFRISCLLWILGEEEEEQDLNEVVESDFFKSIEADQKKEAPLESELCEVPAAPVTPAEPEE